ncbi:MAG TPA: flavohemoglobin expression-modulating QEGLA motif protein [Polyangiaceae bacterium]|nr:flavohemoglobin expression-modulating QEGLA motif protein [Polyangiaceae bacterium]
MTDEQKEALEAAVPVLTTVASRTNVLARIHWPRSVEQTFFAKGADELPEPAYAVDRATAEENVRSLEKLRKSLSGDDPLRELLRRTATSYRDANRLLLAVGTPRFFELSCEIYGGARSMALDVDTTNLDLAEHLLGRLSHQAPAPEGPASIAPPGEPPVDHDALVQALAERLAREQPALEVSVVVSDDVAPKVIAGARQVRVREGARFTPEEARSLFVHEIETHALTAQNGSSQPHLSFLRSGGPRSTRTQEGLAVFAELFDRSLSAARLLRLAERVRMVAMAEGGASFLDVYRHLTAAGVPAREAYLDTVRVFRGGVVAGGAPFTKDTVYLAGLIQVYNFLRTSVTRGTRHVAETLVCGRVALEDMGLLLVLREQGLLTPPVYVPGWLSNWQTLLPYLAFTSFLNEVSLPPPLVRERARGRAEAGERSKA